MTKKNVKKNNDDAMAVMEDNIYDTAIMDANLLAAYGCFKKDEDFLKFLDKRIQFYTDTILKAKSVSGAWPSGISRSPK